MSILLHKVAAVLRRFTHSDVHNLNYRNIVLDNQSHSVSISGSPVDFTLREFEILQELMRTPGEVVTRKMLLSKIWSYDFYGDERIVDTHIKNIRRKLGVEDCIETIRGVGYKLPKEN
jgi:two-component system response regulator VanR